MKSKKRKAPASVESTMGGKKKNVALSTLFAAETRGSNAMSLHHFGKKRKKKWGILIIGLK
jgi:hypothetical protein